MHGSLLIAVGPITVAESAAQELAPAPRV
jgi:hypothetical protein